MSYSARLAAFLLISIGFLVQTSAAGFEVERQRVADRKIVFASVESTDVTTARARISGRLQILTVDEGYKIKRGQRIAVVVGEKLPQQLAALDARITTPLLILTPVPLTLLGIVLGHRLLGAHFTATSKIGFVALAGIVIRNSILLVDFIKAKLAENAPLREALLDVGAVRFKPIALTAISTMAGAVFILADPIFQDLAVSLLFGLLSSTLLTVLVIPAAYICLRR